MKIRYDMLVHIARIYSTSNQLLVSIKFFCDYFGGFQLYFKMQISTFHYSNLFLHPKKHTHTENWFVQRSWWASVDIIKFEKIQKIHCLNARLEGAFCCDSLATSLKTNVVREQPMQQFKISKACLF